MNKIIFDLDGTLADNKHRALYAELKDWRTYFARCHLDTPIEHVIDLLDLLVCEYIYADVEIWSARSDEVREKTVAWIKEHIPIAENVTLRMRESSDHRPDVELKESWLKEEIAAGHTIQMVFDDRNSVVAMWRRNGIPCFQVADGDF